MPVASTGGSGRTPYRAWNHFRYTLSFTVPRKLNRAAKLRAKTRHLHYKPRYRKHHG